MLKDTLQWDPAVDVLLNRLPNRFIAPGHTPGAADRGRDQRTWPPAWTTTTRS